MKVSLSINGKFQIELQPETPTERLVLQEMIDRAGKGRMISLHRKAIPASSQEAEDPPAIVSVEQ